MERIPEHVPYYVMSAEEHEQLNHALIDFLIDRYGIFETIRILMELGVTDEQLAIDFHFEMNDINYAYHNYDIGYNFDE